jgi:hypothetical protein
MQTKSLKLVLQTLEEARAEVEALTLVDKAAEHDTYIRYKEALTASDEKTFSLLGIYEFENRVTRRKCYVICHIEGEKPASKDPKDAIIHPTGTATWTGPILNASSVLFSEDDADAMKR